MSTSGAGRARLTWTWVIAMIAVSLVAVGASISLRPSDEDSDHDGLPNTVEALGWASFANGVYVTDPNDPDTDDDGLTDGEEAGALVSKDSERVFVAHSSPTLEDSDSDTVGDAEEFVLDMDARSRDTDDDGLDDDVELKFGSDPTLENADDDSYNDKEEYERGSDPLSYDLTKAEGAQALIAGAIPGEGGFLDRVFHVEDARRDCTEYLIGKTIVGAIGLGDVQKIIGDFEKGDYLAMSLALVKALPQARFIRMGQTAAKVAKYAAMSAGNARAVLTYVEKNGLSDSLSEEDLLTAIGRNPRALPIELEGGPEDLAVYVAQTPDESVALAGMTRDPAARRAQMRRGIELEIIDGDVELSRGQARAVLEALGSRPGGHLIDPEEEYYDQAVAWGEDWLAEHANASAEAPR